jgi:hypothetical protein
VRIFGHKLRTCRILGSHQIRDFCRRSEQLVSWEARREFKEASAHVLRAEASPEATLTVAKHRPSRLTVAELRCRSPPIKVSVIEFPSSLWSHRSKPHWKPTTVARENSNSGELPCSTMMHRRESEPAPSPVGTSHLDCRIGDERPKLEAGLPVRSI